MMYLAANYPRLWWGASALGAGLTGVGVNPATPAARTVPDIASSLLKASGGSVSKALPQLQVMNLGQSKTIEVLQQMYKASGRGSFVQGHTEGVKLLLSRRIGPHQPILGISSSGQVKHGTATIELTGDLEMPMRAIDIVF